MTDYRRKAAEQFSAAFMRDTRPDGETFIRLEDDAPEWMTDAIREAHGRMLPDDVKYTMCEEVAERLADRDSDEWDDAQGEECDSLVDVYNGDLIKWLGSHGTRAAYIDEAQEEGLIDPNADTFKRLQIGQYMEYAEIWSVLQSACEDAGDDLESEADAEADDDGEDE